MKKRFSLLFVCLALTFSLFSCGYNRIMRDHLSDANNYKQYNATLVNIYYSYEEHDLSEVFEKDKTDTVKAVFLDVCFDNKQDIAPFWGVSEESLNKDFGEYVIRLKLLADNAKLLLENGFFDVIQKGDTLTLKSSSFIYQDTNFFFISTVSYNGVCYLDEATGFQNIMDFIEQRKSLL